MNWWHLLTCNITGTSQAKSRTGLSFPDTWVSAGKLPKFLLDHKHLRENSFRPGLGFYCLVGWLVGWFVLFLNPMVSGKPS